jgi:hypothetical protein
LNNGHCFQKPGNLRIFLARKRPKQTPLNRAHCFHKQRQKQTLALSGKRGLQTMSIVQSTLFVDSSAVLGCIMLSNRFRNKSTDEKLKKLLLNSLDSQLIELPSHVFAGLPNPNLMI